MNNVSTSLFPQFITEIIKSIAKEEGFMEHAIHGELLSDQGNNFVGILIKASIKGKRLIEDNLVNSKLVLLVKYLPEDSPIKDIIIPLFKRESIAFNKVLPAFEKYQLDKGIIKGENGFFAYPKCYHASYDEHFGENVIITEDVKEKGFQYSYSFLPLDLPKVKRLMEELGRFHAISIAFKEEYPEKFAEFRELRSVLDEIGDEEQLHAIIKMNGNRAELSLDTNETLAKHKVEWICDNLIQEMAKCSNPILAEPYAVIIHGDCWINNVMFRHEAGLTKGVCLSDFQLLRYCSPVVDLVHFIFNCTDKHLRSQHFDTLIQVYYTALREHLELLGGDANRQFPMTALLRQFKLFGKFGFCTALHLQPMLAGDNAKSIDREKIKEDILRKDPQYASESPVEIYNYRMSAIIRDSIKLGYL